MNLVQFKEMFPKCPKGFEEATLYVLNDVFQKYELNTPERVAAFCAQIGHECGDFKYKEELADGSAYEGRKDLGNVNPGDGRLFKGRGWIQLTGRANYTKYSSLLGIDLVKDPQKATAAHVAGAIAGEYWKQNKLNALADSGDFDKITKRINGGFNGKRDRDERHARARKALGIS